LTRFREPDKTSAPISESPLKTSPKTAKKFLEALAALQNETLLALGIPLQK
jgi:hypothetical protein